MHGVLVRRVLYEDRWTTVNSGLYGVDVNIKSAISMTTMTTAITCMSKPILITQRHGRNSLRTRGYI